MPTRINRKKRDISLDKEAGEYSEKLAAARRGLVLLLTFWFVVLTVVAWWRS
jgi:hypothetical protein